MTGRNPLITTRHLHNKTNKISSSHEESMSSTRGGQVE